MKQIQIWLGHANFSTTADIYAHLDVSAQMGTGDVAGTFYAKPDRKPCERISAPENARGGQSPCSDAEDDSKPEKPIAAKKKGAARSTPKGVETCTKKTSSSSSRPTKGTATCRKRKPPAKV